MKKESWGFILMIVSYVIAIIAKVVLYFASVSYDVYINTVLTTNIIITMLMIIGLILIIIENKDNAFVVIASVLLILSPLASIGTTWARLGFSVETESSRILMAQSINFAPVIIYLFILSLYNRLNTSGRVLTMSYIAVSLISLISSMILNYFIHDMTVELFKLFSNISSYLYYIQTILIIGVLVINLEFSLTKKQQQ